MSTVKCFYCTDEYKNYMKPIAKLSASAVYLNNEQLYRGRCVVVLDHHKTELYQLNDDELASFMKDVSRVAQAIHMAFKPDKINYAVYGDIDSHIHFHVVPKYRNVKNWGWAFELSGADNDKTYLTDDEYDKVISMIKSYLGAAEQF